MSSEPVEAGRKHPTVCVLTLGCKVNQFESASMTEQLVKAGFVPVSREEPADITIINSCTVTHRADFEVRALVRRAHRTNPLGRTIVTGCLAQLRPDELLALPGIGAVTGQNHKEDILSIVEKVLGGEEPRSYVQPHDTKREMPCPGFPEFDRARAFFKIQDGCSACCTYCTVPKARGPSRSLARDRVLAGVRAYGRLGYDEVVLTGIHLGAWGQDFTPTESFTDLMILLGKEASLPRLRLSSMEPNEVTPGIIDLITQSQKFCPHLHLPLQSGSDRILEAMGRPYSTKLFSDLVRQVTRLRPDICVGADVLVGFPGEGEADFDQTYEFLKQLSLAYFHVFPYSPRPGTVAARFNNQVDSGEKKRRVALLRELGERKREEFREGQVGEVRSTLVENPGGRDDSLPKGITDNYIPVLIEGGNPPARKVVPVRLLKRIPGAPLKGILVKEN